MNETFDFLHRAEDEPLWNGWEEVTEGSTFQYGETFSEQLIDLLGLTKILKRDYKHDAHGPGGEPFEVKTTSRAKYVSTCRKFTIKVVNQVYLKEYWVFGAGRVMRRIGTAEHRMLFTGVWLAHPSMLKNEFDRIAKPLEVRQRAWDRIRCDGACFGQLTDDEKLQFDRIPGEGISLNDPPIRLDYVKSHCFGISTDPEQAKLQTLQFIAEHPLDAEAVTVRNGLDFSSGVGDEWVEDIFDDEPIT